MYWWPAELFASSLAREVAIVLWFKQLGDSNNCRPFSSAAVTTSLKEKELLSSLERGILKRIDLSIQNANERKASSVSGIWSSV